MTRELRVPRLPLGEHRAEKSPRGIGAPDDALNNKSMSPPLLVKSNRGTTPRQENQTIRSSTNLRRSMSIGNGSSKRPPDHKGAAELAPKAQKGEGEGDGRANYHQPTTLSRTPRQSTTTPSPPPPCPPSRSPEQTTSRGGKTVNPPMQSLTPRRSKTPPCPARSPGTFGTTPRGFLAAGGTTTTPRGGTTTTPRGGATTTPRGALSARRSLSASLPGGSITSRGSVTPRSSTRKLAEAAEARQEQEKQELLQKLADAKLILEKKEQELLEKRQEIDELRADNNTSMVSFGSDLLEQHQQTIGELTEQRNTANHVAKDLKAEVRWLKSDLNALRSSIDVSSTTKDVTSKVLLDVSQTAMAATTENAHLQQQVWLLDSLLQSETAVKESEIAQIAHEKREMEQMNAGLCNEVEFLQAKLRVRDSEVSRLKQSETYLAEKITSLERRAAGAAEQLEFASTNAAEEAKSVDQELASLALGVKAAGGARLPPRKELLDFLRQTLKDKDAAIIALEQSQHSLTAKLTCSSSRLTSLEADLANASAEGRRLATQVECIKGEYDQQQDKIVELAWAAADVHKQLQVSEEQDSRTRELAAQKDKRGRAMRILMPVGAVTCGVLGAVIRRPK